MATVGLVVVMRRTIKNEMTWMLFVGVGLCGWACAAQPSAVLHPPWRESAPSEQGRPLASLERLALLAGGRQYQCARLKGVKILVGGAAGRGGQF